MILNGLNLTSPGNGSLKYRYDFITLMDDYVVYFEHFLGSLIALAIRSFTVKIQFD
jgi:hypothetical protein